MIEFGWTSIVIIVLRYNKLSTNVSNIANLSGIVYRWNSWGTVCGTKFWESKIASSVGGWYHNDIKGWERARLANLCRCCPPLNAASGTQISAHRFRMWRASEGCTGYRNSGSPAAHLLRSLTAPGLWDVNRDSGHLLDLLEDAHEQQFTSLQS